MASYRYYYFIPQLAHLSYGQLPPEPAEAFRARAMALIDRADAALLAGLALGLEPEAKPSGCDLIDGWREWETALRLNLARLRTKALGRSEELPSAPAFPASAVQAAARAMEAESPLEAERIADRARWDAVQALQGGELFHRRTVFAHLMKLLILERQASFQAEAGFSQYKSLYDSILERAPGEAGPGENLNDRN